MKPVLTRGAISAAILTALAASGPMTAAELAAVTGLLPRVVERACWHLKSTGRLRVAGTVRMPPARKPLMRYALPQRPQAGATTLTEAWR